ncbi:MAG: hypothetical protein OXE40_00440 [Gammaproteobacteria bacterium]|nr:hypothetical protein [Gammaproteobacteria bacterium]
MEGHYGHIYICDRESVPAARGAIVAEAGRNERAVILATFDLGAIDEGRVNWGVIRDRRPELYKTILTLGGHSPRIGT